MPTAHTPSPEVAPTAPLLTQLIGDTTSAIHPGAQCKRSQPYLASVFCPGSVLVEAFALRLPLLYQAISLKHIGSTHLQYRDWITRCLIPGAHTFGYFQSLGQFVRRHPVRIWWPLLDPRDQEVSELQMGLLTWLQWLQQFCEASRNLFPSAPGFAGFSKVLKTWK